MTRIAKAVVATSLAFNTALLAIAIVSRLQLQELAEPARRFALHCSGVRDAMRMDAREFRDPLRRDRALSRFGSEISFHSDYEIEMCLTAPLDLSRCGGAGSYGCRARLADEAAEHIPGYEDR